MNGRERVPARPAAPPDAWPARTNAAPRSLSPRVGRRLAIVAGACVVLLAGCNNGPSGAGDRTATTTATRTPTPTPTLTPTPPTQSCDVTNPCPAGEFCELPVGICASGLDSGTCVDVLPLCTGVFEPVCGCDGLTYGNDCLRRGARVQPSHEGACAGLECREDCDCYALRTFALPCPLECATCDNYWTCADGHCFEHCGPVPFDQCPRVGRSGTGAHVSSKERAR